MNKIVVLDTNVLLADPNSVLSFPRAQVVIPEVVLGELDKLKTARVDPDLRFRGREVSRILFELSEVGSLIEGVELPDGGSLRVAPFENEGELPSGLQTRNADDRILATAFQVCSASGKELDVTLITNDLNMLLKAQTLGITVERYADGVDGSFARNYIIRPFQRYKTPITILAVALAVFLAVIVIALYMQRQPQNSAATLPAEFQNVLTPAQQKALNALQTLQTNPKDPEALLGMANFYYDQRNTAADVDPVTALELGRQSIRYFERYLVISPQDRDAKVDLAALYFYNGQTDQAIRLVGEVLKLDKDHVNANFNLGIFYWKGPQRDFKAGAAQFQKVKDLTVNDSQAHGLYQQADAFLTQLKTEAKAAGRPIETTAGVQQ